MPAFKRNCNVDEMKLFDLVAHKQWKITMHYSTVALDRHLLLLFVTKITIVQNHVINYKFAILMFTCNLKCNCKHAIFGLKC